MNRKRHISARSDFSRPSNEDREDGLTIPTISCERYKGLADYMKKNEHPALLPIRIACNTGLRIGEACALTW